MTDAGNTSTTAVSTRCPRCGRRSSVAGACMVCGASEDSVRQEIVATPRTAPAAFAPAGSAFITAIQPLRAATLSASPRSIPTATTGSAEISGRVIIVGQSANEPMDFDPWRWIAIPTWGLVLLISPVVLAILVWQSFGLILALGVAVCALFVLRFLFSNRLLQSWHLTAALNGRHIVEPMPVTMLRLRQGDDREIQLHLKGHIHGGAVMEGDRIIAFGTWRRGVLRVRRIGCERTGATIIPHQPNARALAICGIGVLLAGGLWLYAAGIPWVKEQARSFRESVEQQVLRTQGSRL